MFKVLDEILKNRTYIKKTVVKYLDKGYWENFKTIVEDVKEMIGNVEMD